MSRKNIPSKKNKRRAKRRGQISASGAVLCMLSVVLGVFLLFTTMNSGEEGKEDTGIQVLSAQVLAAQAQPLATPTPTPVPTPLPTPEPTPQNARIRFAGDLVVHTNVLEGAYNKQDKAYDFTPVFEHIAESLSDADYTIANIDGALCGNEKRPYAGYSPPAPAGHSPALPGRIRGTGP